MGEDTDLTGEVRRTTRSDPPVDLVVQQPVEPIEPGVTIGSLGRGSRLDIVFGAEGTCFGHGLKLPPLVPDCQVPVLPNHNEHPIVGDLLSRDPGIHGVLAHLGVVPLD